MRRVICFLLVYSIAVSAAKVDACPFCSAIANSISEDLVTADVTVVAKWVDTARNRAALAAGPAKKFDDKDPLSLRDFQVIRIYKGSARLGTNARQIQAPFRGRPEPNQVFLIFGFDGQTINWSAALPLRKESLVYLDALPGLPKSGPERLKHFLPYLDHPEPALADDAYNEFARAPYEEVKQARPYLDRSWLLSRIADERTDARRRRLYLTLLGVCGEPSDGAAVYQVMQKLEGSNEPGLDAAIACYLTLTKSEGLQQIEERYLTNQNVEFKAVYSAIMALRFHGEESEVISRQRLGAALQRVLHNPQLAELVIADLARWEDWTATKEIAKLLQTSTDEHQRTRVAAARYLMACPNTEAKQLLAKLQVSDPSTVRGARSVLPAPIPDPATSNSANSANSNE